ncbi:MAG: FAD-dependent oxidoreductase [Treponema sp.]|nr:FAD-dependent oxidoreductase [Treponema sp.]MCL2237720.1 FAD-dependent oxidoreductase [Treponema sp.]
MSINITINGKQCEAKPNQSVLDACRENGVVIPTLCHDPRLNPFGSCMICRVEIEGERGVPLSCGAQVRDGMVIRTESDAIKKSRKTCLELLLSQHYGDCTAPCVLECPAHTDVQGYIRHIANGHYDEALKLIKETNPLPVVCGRICTRPCETKCRRNILEGKVGIAYLKRFVADIDLKKGVGRRPGSYLPAKKSPTGKKAAIIGAGPAGLSAAWFLTQEGHSVTIYEKQESPGGMLRYGIPSYRMPRETLDQEIEIIKSLGVQIVYNKEFGKDITVNSLKADGAGAILLAVGSQKGYPLGVDGESKCANVLIGIEFLGSVTRGKHPDFNGKKIAVVGGGNTAMDCVRTSMRLGAQNVKLIYRRTIKEMPADELEIEEAQLEGVEFDILTNPLSVSQSGSTVTMKLTKMELGEPDASGRRSPRPVAGSEYNLDVDYVISAIGQTQDLSFISGDCSVSTNRDCIVADTHTMMTNIDGVFAAGDGVTGPKTAIMAIAGGKRAALAMSHYMNGKTIAAEEILYNHLKAKDYKDIDSSKIEAEEIEKIHMPMLTEEQRSHNFKEVELGFSEEQAKKEAQRCLQCGCADADECKLRNYAAAYNANQDAFAGEQITHPIDDSHRFIVRDRNKCILCARCVRICIESGSGVFGFVGRGFDTTVEPPFSLPLGEEKTCNSCGLCVSTCPTGALTPRKDVKLPTTAYTDRAHAENGLGEGSGASEAITSIEEAIRQAKRSKINS